MPRTLLEKCCVRIAVNFPDGSKILGSGMIVSNDETYYVVTAAHCLCNQQFDWKTITSDMILIEYQDDYLSDHKSIITKGVLDLSHDLDWCVIEIENPAIDCDFSKVNFGVEFEAGEKVFLQDINKLIEVAKGVGLLILFKLLIRIFGLI
ncbi:serine protease [Sphingobacterium sp. KU25419]|nr:serine protease [Sphingobacterium sp. KU25419]